MVKNDEVLQIYVSESLKDWIETYCSEQGISISTFVRMLINKERKELDKNEWWTKNWNKNRSCVWNG